MHRADYERPFLRLVAARLAPVVPLALTMIPLDELLKTLFGILYSTSFETPLV
jgi:hypothetical protein